MRSAMPPQRSHHMAPARHDPYAEEAQYSAPPMHIAVTESRPSLMSIGATPMQPNTTHNSHQYLLMVRSRVLSLTCAFLGLMTFVSFWALYFWPVLLAFLLLYVGVVSFKLSGHGESFGVLLMQSSLLANREVYVGAFVIAFVLSIAECIVGLVLAIYSDSSTRTAFQVVAVVTGALSMIVLFLLQATLRFADRIATGGGQLRQAAPVWRAAPPTPNFVVHHPQPYGDRSDISSIPHSRMFPSDDAAAPSVLPPAAIAEYRNIRPAPAPVQNFFASPGRDRSPPTAIGGRSSSLYRERTSGRY